MFKKTLLVVALMAGAAQASAQMSAEYDALLPPLPKATDLSDADIGQHFLLRRGYATEQVFFAGYGPGAVPIAFSSTEILEQRTTWNAAVAYCAGKGEGWRLPDINELRIVTPLVDGPGPDYQPGSYWTTTPAPCLDCGNAEIFKMTYDIGSSSVRNVYALDFSKFYTVCAYPIP